MRPSLVRSAFSRETGLRRKEDVRRYALSENPRLNATSHALKTLDSGAGDPGTTGGAGTRRALTVIVVAAIMLRVSYALLPLSDLVTRVTPDDAYYYFQIGRNISAGHGVSFDGEVPTNGFHPLWLGIVTLCYFLPIPDAAALRMALLSSAVLSSVGCVLLFRIVRNLTHEDATAIAAAAAYGLSPAAAIASVNGLESGVAMTAFLYCVDRLVAVLNTGQRSAVVMFGFGGA